MKLSVMRSSRRRRRVLLGASAALSLAACSRIVDFDRFGFETDAAVVGDDHDLAPEADLSRGDLAGADLAGGVLTPSNGVSCTQMGPSLQLTGEVVIDTEAARLESRNGELLLAGEVQQGDIAMFCSSSISISDQALLTAKGKNRIAFVVEDSFYLNGEIKLYGAQGSTGGDGANAGPGGGEGGDHNKPAISVTDGPGGGSAGLKQLNPAGVRLFAGGGGGGGSRLAGAPGGAAEVLGALGGVATPVGNSGLPRFRGGGGGGGGGDADSSGGKGGGGGGGGGALQVTALGGAGLILFGPAAQIDVSGGGGGGGEISSFVSSGSIFTEFAGGGGGGGGGGMLWLEAASVTLPSAPMACITALGGGGGNGASSVGTLLKNGESAKRAGMCPHMASTTTGTGLPGKGRGGVGVVPTGGEMGLDGIDGLVGGGGGGGSPGSVYVRSRNAIDTTRTYPQATSVIIP